MGLKDWVVFDVEGDDLDATLLYCLSYHRASGEKGSLTTYDEMREFFRTPGLRIGHNIGRWDLPTLERILEIEIKDDFVDTLFLSWTLFPGRAKSYGLEAFGEDYGVPKPKISSWVGLSLEEYVHRCEQDVEINTRLWNDLLSYLVELYDTQDDIENYLRYLAFKARCARLQEESKWRIDVKMVSEKLKELEDERTTRYRDLEGVMPKVPCKAVKSPPKRMFKGDGELSSLGEKWQEFLVGQGLPREHDEPVEYIHHFDDPNPSSPQQIKDWLYGLGWKPQTFKYQRNKETGDTREIPQVNLPHGAGLCPSVSDLFDVAPELELLDQYGALSHRIGLLRGFLRDVKRGCLEAKIQGLTNTLRFKHAEIVNLPKPDKPYAEPVRSAFIAREGYELCGSDMSSLEDRIKQHFIFEYDPDYVRTMMDPDFDPHLDIAVLGGLMTQEQADAYKAGDKTHKKIRDKSKNTNYAGQYGAGAKRIALTADISIEEATKLHKTYWDRNWAIKQIAEDQVVKTVRGQMWLLNPISGFWYSLRYMKDRFSTLVQGTAAFVFDLWVMKILERREQLTAQFHDEVVLEVRKGFREECTALIMEAIQEVNSMLGLNRELGVDVQYGDRYSEIH